MKLKIIQYINDKFVNFILDKPQNHLITFWLITKDEKILKEKI